MISPSRFFASVAFTMLLGAASMASAAESFESLVKKLADDQYAVRMEAKRALIEMCRKEPKLLDALAPVAFDEQDEVERVLNAREIIFEAVYVERGAIGFALNMKLAVDRMEEDGPAHQSGMQVGWQLIAVRGNPVDGMTVEQVYAMVHATRPGTDIEMEFVTQEGKKVVCRPIAVARGTIRSDENAAERKKQCYEEWRSKKLEELQLQAD